MTDDPKENQAALAKRIEDRTEELTTRWHRELEERLRTRPQNVFPGSTLLDGMPDVILWLARFMADGQELAPDQERSLHGLAEFWHQSGCSIEESLLHVRILGTILHEAMREEMERLPAEIPAVHAVTIAQQLSEGLNRVESVLVGTYRDEEEDRFADFGATLAHEVRGQLNVAATAAELLWIDADDPSESAAERRRASIGRISNAVQRAADLVAAVRKFSRVRAGFGQWTMTPLDRIVEDIVSGCQDEAENGTTIEVDGHPPAVAVPTEPVQLALHNLVENAVRYSDPEKPERWVRLQCAEDEKHERWLIQVDDNGIGIPRSEQERVFARFLRGQRADGDGFGLGLAIARQAVRSMGGSISLESAEGEGSTFSITIPFDETRPSSRA